MKGHMCPFRHESRSNVAPQQVQTNQPQACRRGPRCEFLSRGICFYFHQGYRGQEIRGYVVRGQEIRGQENRGQENRSRDQEFRGQWQEREARDGEQRPCHFQERCWNTVCRFTHQDFTKEQEFLENY